MSQTRHQLDWLEQALAELDRQMLRRYPVTCSSKPDGQIIVHQSETKPAADSQLSADDVLSEGEEGELDLSSDSALMRAANDSLGMPESHPPGDEGSLANFGANDYLGLATDPRLAEAASLAARESGWGSGASPLITGRTPWHERLQTALAEFEGTEAALLFTSGFAANAGTIPAITDQGDAIFGDAKNHASIIDGCRLSRAKVFVYPHIDADALEKMLRETQGQFRRRLIVTDTLFSMDGNFAPLVRLGELAEQYDAMLMVDEAHATGVFGKQGLGVAEWLGVEEQIDIRVGTLSKALGSHGGFVAGRKSLIDFLANRARSYVFATSPPAALAAASLQAVKLTQEEPWRREELLRNAAKARETLRSQGWNIGRSQSQIIPLIVGDPERALKLAAALRRRGFFVPAIRPPSVPPGESLLRISLSYAHSPELLEELLKTLQALRS